MSLRRTIHILLVAVVLLVLLAACQSGPPSLVGSWRGKYYSDSARVAFNADGTFIFYAYGGLSEGTYTVNTEVVPNQLDLIFKDETEIHTIFELTDADTFQMENVYPGDERPTEFSDVIVFTRQEENPNLP